MESDKVVIIKSRGPRRVGLKRTSIQGKAMLATNDSAASESEPPDSAIDESESAASDQEPNDSLSKGTERSVSAINEAGLSESVPMDTEPSEIESEVSDHTKKALVSDSVQEGDVPLESSDSTAIKIVPKDESSSENNEMIVPDGDSTKIVKEEIKENDNLSSEDSEEFLGFQSVPSPTTKPIFKKLIANAQSEIDQEDTKLATDGIRAMYGDDEEAAIQAAIVARTKEPRMGNGVGRKKKREADGSFDNMKLLSEVSSEVTSSNDVSNNANDSYKTSEEVPSEVTSSATNSPSMAGASKSPASASRPKRAARATKSSVDVSDPIFRKPFEYGWKRELVYRNSNDSSSKVQADIYYYAPSGKKVRSTREIVEHLYGCDLTLENFTFFKEPVGIEDTEKEIIRIAKRVSVGGSAVVTPKRLTTPKTPKAAKDPLALTPKVSPDSAEKAGTSKLPSRGFPRIKITASQLLRGSPGTSKGKGRGRKAQASDGDDMEVGMLPPSWSQPMSNSEPVVAAPPAKKRKREPEVVEAPVVAPKRPKKSPEEPVSAPTVVAAGVNYPAVIAFGYNAMVNVFQYLKVKELARAARVCKMWRDLADNTSLWRVVRMKNSQVDDWEGFVSSLVRHGTQQLDLRKMLLPTEQADIDNLWRAFLKEISRATSLVRVDLCRCPAFVVEELPAACPGLAVLNAVAIKCSTINLESLANFTCLQELRLKSMTGCHLASNMDAFKSMLSLKHLSLTTFKDLGQAGPEVIGLLINLESLEIGECSDLDDDFSTKVLCKLTKLNSLRLEKGQGKTCPTFSLLEGVKDLPALTQLELVNFDIKAGFSEALAQCTNIKRLLIIPTYVTQSATTNHMVLSAVTELKDSLSHLVWGVTNELLRVTELFIDQCDTAKEGGNRVKAPKIPKSPDSIPIMKPEKCKNDWDSSDSKSMSSPIGQVKILTLSKLQQVLVTQLPNTKIKILKVPFQSTWRQSISEPMV